MVHLIVGYGEVGSALHKVLKEAWIYDPWVIKQGWDGHNVDVVHICIPFNETFNKTVWEFKKKAKLVIVHSTVPVGTCDALKVVHSPINGVHPHLVKGIKTFVKYFGGKDAKKAANIFKKLGIRTRVFKKARDVEASKLWSTTQYGRLIMLEKEIHVWCEKNKVDFDVVYTQTNKDYNEGYIKLGRPDVVRSVLKHMEGPIGGHCIMPNAKLLGVKI